MKNLILLSLLFYLSCGHFNERKIANDPLDLTEKVSTLDLQKIQISEIDLRDLSLPRRLELNIIKENFLKYMLHACFKEAAEKARIIDEGEIYFESMIMRLMENIAKEKAKVTDFYPIKRPPFWTIETEISFLNIEVRKQGFITQISDDTWDKFYSMLKHTDLDLLPPELLNQFNVDVDSKDIIRDMQSAGNRKQALLRLHHKLENKFASSITRFKNIGSEIVDSGVIEINNPLHKKFLVILMNTYFENLDLEILKTMISEIISLGKKPEFNDLTRIVFTNAGPAMGKLMQTLSKSPEIGKEFASMISILESENKQVPYHLVQKLLEQDKGGHQFSLIEEKALGTGTMAQVQRARLLYDSEEYDVAVRFMKPGIEARVKNDLDIMNLIIAKIKADNDFKDFKMLDFDRLLEVINNFFVSEMDLDATTRVQQRVFPIYNRVIDVQNKRGNFIPISFRVPKIYPGPNDKTQIQVQELIKNGKKFSQIKSAEDQKLVARAFAELWFEEALLESGFLHADPHQGNMFIHKDPITKEISVAIFDYGMTAFLSKEVRRSFLMIGAGVELKSADLIYRGIDSANPKFDKKELKILKEKIAEQFKIQELKTAEDWILWAVQNKYIDSPDLGNLARGATLVKQMLEVNGDGDYILKMLQKKVLLKMGKQLVDPTYDFPLSLFDKIRLGKAVVIKSCHDVINFFLNIKK